MRVDRLHSGVLNQFPFDRSGNTLQRDIGDYFGASVLPVHYPSPRLLHYNSAFGEEIGLGIPESDDDIALLNAQKFPSHITPYATAYAGHQFGRWAGQLGDGRAIFIGQIADSKNRNWELQWKGAGATPFSRHADGRAVLRSTVREYLISEAMHHLGVPTTRSLSLSITGENVLRDILYNGKSAPEPGAMMIRGAESFIRFGHFEFWSAKGNVLELRKLADYVIDNFFPQIQNKGTEKYSMFFDLVCKKTAELIVEWMRVGFTHGVLNTDNMSTLGLGIDYGPFSFLDEFDLNFTSNTTDLPGRRYAFGQQAKVAQWNLWQLANALYPLVENPSLLEASLDNFVGYFWETHDKMIHRKFGLSTQSQLSKQLIMDVQSFMQQQKIDFTIFFLLLENFEGQVDSAGYFEPSFYRPLSLEERDQFSLLLHRYLELGKNQGESNENRKLLMKSVNPQYVLRNYMLYGIIKDVENGILTSFLSAWERLAAPYDSSNAQFSLRRPPEFDKIPGCSMLSCSS